MWDRLAIYGVPAAAGLLTAAVLLGPGQERTVVGARVRGLLVASSPRYALRIQTLEHYRGRYQPRPLDSLTLEVRSGGATLASWTGPSAPSGTAEAQGPLSRPLGTTAQIELSWQGRPLGTGSVQARGALEVEHLTELAGQREGTLGIHVRLPRGVAVPPFPEPVEITVLVPGERNAEGATPTIAAKALGGTVEDLALQPARPDSHHRWLTTVTPDAPNVELTIRAAHQGQSGSWQGPIPVVLGRLWLTPGSRRGLRIGSAMVHSTAYVSILSPLGRWWGGEVGLSEDAEQLSYGRLPLPELPDGPLLAVLSSDPSEPSGATIGWPLRPELGTLSLEPLEVLLDGMPKLVAAEQQRRRSARRPIWGLVLAAALFEILFLYRRHRVARLRLEEELERKATEAALPSPDLSRVAGGPGLGWLTILAGAVLLAFLALAGLAAWG